MLQAPKRSIKLGSGLIAVVVSKTRLGGQESLMRSGSGNDKI